MRLPHTLIVGQEYSFTKGSFPLDGGNTRHIMRTEYTEYTSRVLFYKIVDEVGGNFCN